MGKPVINITTRLNWDPAYKAAHVKEAAQAALIGVGRWWQTGIAPWHFETFATPKYGYRPRSKKYEARKQKELGHKRPNVWSTHLRSKTLNAAVVTSGAKKIWVRLNIHGGFPERRLEVFRRTMNENRQIVEMLELPMMQFLRAPTPPRVLSGAEGSSFGAGGPMGALEGSPSPGDAAAVA